MLHFDITSSVILVYNNKYCAIPQIQQHVYSMYGVRVHILTLNTRVGWYNPRSCDSEVSPSRSNPFTPNTLSKNRKNVLALFKNYFL
jgi:hypothetical protein